MFIGSLLNSPICKSWCYLMTLLILTHSFFSKYFQSPTFLYLWDFATRICDSPCCLSSLEGKAPHLHTWSHWWWPWSHWGWQRSSVNRVAFSRMGVWGRVGTLTLKEELGHGLATNVEGYGHLENTCHLSPVTRPHPPIVPQDRGN